MRVVLSTALELLVDFPKSTLEAPGVDRENGARVPHLAHSLCEGLDEVSVVPHHVVWVHLVLVRRMLFVANLALISVCCDLFWIVRDPSEEVSHVRGVRDALHR